MRPTSRGLGRAVAIVATGTLLVSGCSEPPRAAGALPAVLDPVAEPSPSVAPVPLSLAITPPPGAKGQALSSEIGITLAGGEISDVNLTRADGAKIEGALREDGTSWVPSGPLTPATTYKASVTAHDPLGTTQTRTTTFTTMGAPGRETGTGLYLFSGQTVGVAMPVVIEFQPAVPEPARAAVQRRLFVTSSPAQPGAWHWVGGGQVWYRPATYWQSGTTISVRSGLRGAPMGNGFYGDVDRSATVTVGPKFVMTVDNATKQMHVYADDALVKTFPVSLGKASTPSSSGTTVVMEMEEHTVFDTTGTDGAAGYRANISYAMRLTWGGEFIHAAPWSVGDQGRRNVSHGCVNLSTPNSAWLFAHAHIGDPVTIRGTEAKLARGNGWTAWDLPWTEYVQGSAIPVPAATVAAGNAAAAAAREPVGL
jgi:lipoprotein-anchoring transpeptidase ErfK/SrfK